MRKFGLPGIAIALVIGVASAGAAAAQSSTEGPLAVPNAVPTKAKSSKPSHHKKVVHRETTQSSDYNTSSQIPQPVIHAGHDAPADPLSLGMKWNGSNDDARATRVQNYDGNAVGTGAEVGLKLHF